MAFLKLLISFAPWIAFLLIAHDTLFRVKIGLLVALALSIVLGIARINKGIILWVTVIFFACASVAVVAFENLWALIHMGVLANGDLAAAAWLTAAMKRPFTLDYAKEHVDRSLWSDPQFTKTNYIITSVWAAVFTINAGLAYLKMRRSGLPDLAYDLTSYAFLVGAVFFSDWYPKHLRKVRSAPLQ